MIDSPLGDLLAVRGERGLSGLYLPTGRHPKRPEPTWQRDETGFADVHEQLAAYFAGDRQAFDLDLHPTGTGFQRSVWTALCDIPYGQTMSSAYVWKSIATLICWTPPTTRLRTKSRTARVSGALNAAGPR